MSSIKDLEARSVELTVQMDALRDEHNTVHAEFQALTASGGKPRQLDLLRKRGDLIQSQQRLLATERDAITNELGPARATVRDARSNLDYLGSERTELALGTRAVAKETRRLKMIIAETEG